MTIRDTHSASTVYTVSRLNREVRALLESGWSMIWLEGEISNLSRPASGHLYFSLKDSQAQVRCALFRNRALLLRRHPENGQRVRARARVSLYEPRGEYQLIVEQLEDVGEGALRAAFEALRARLAAEGLFAQERKRPLPRFPRRLGLITSPSGAAIRDVLSVLGRRFPGLPVRVYPVPVQGEAAAPAIVRALALASQRRDCELLLLVRGGGSLEDLWPFNEETVARAIRACALPVVCGVGHETDFTIADFAADLRAPTPSAAAELVSPDRAALTGQVQRLRERLAAAQGRTLADRRQRLAWLEQRLLRQHPGRRLLDRMQRLDEGREALAAAMALRLERLDARLANLATRLAARAPRERLRDLEQRRRVLATRLAAAMARNLERRRARLGTAARALQGVSPLATLERGYAILLDGLDQVVRDATQVIPGDTLRARLAKGALELRVIGKVTNN